MNQTCIMDNYKDHRLLFHFLDAYVFPKENSVEGEYEKLIRNKKN